MFNIVFILHCSLMTLVSQLYPSFQFYVGGNGGAEGILGYFTSKMEIITHLPCLPYRVIVGNKLTNESDCQVQVFGMATLEPLRSF